MFSFDPHSRSTFASLSSWLADARALASPDLMVVLVGNKVDLEDEGRQVGELEASDWAKAHDCLFLETSSLTGESVSSPFLLLTRAILLSIESGRIDPDRPGSGISYGERALKRVASWSGSGGGFENSPGGGTSSISGRALRMVGLRKLQGKCC